MASWTDYSVGLQRGIEIEPSDCTERVPHTRKEHAAQAWKRAHMLADVYRDRTASERVWAPRIELRNLLGDSMKRQEEWYHVYPVRAQPARRPRSP